VGMIPWAVSSFPTLALLWLSLCSRVNFIMSLLLGYHLGQ